jgi:hypothetical protein
VAWTEWAGAAGEVGDVFADGICTGVGADSTVGVDSAAGVV